MSFDVNAVVQQMVQAMITEASKSASQWASKREDAMKLELEKEKQELASIADDRINGNINDAGAEQRLEDVKENLRVAMLAEDVAELKARQDAINAAVSIFWVAVQAGAKAVGGV